MNIQDTPNLRFPHLYVVVRIDDDIDSGPVEQRIAIVSAFHSSQAAEREATRLSALLGAKPGRYIVMITRVKDRRREIDKSVS